MRPVICFQRNKGRAETMDARLLPVDTKWGKKKGIRTQLRERENESRGERTSDRVVGIHPLLRGSQIVVEIPCRNFNFKLSNSKASTPILWTWLSQRRVQTWTIILLLCFILTWLQIAYMDVASPLNSYKSVSELWKYSIFKTINILQDTLRQ